MQEAAHLCNFHAHHRLLSGGNDGGGGGGRGGDCSESYVVRLLDTFIAGRHFCLVLEHCATSLDSLLPPPTQPPRTIAPTLETPTSTRQWTQAAREVGLQLVLALHAFKRCGVVHADIKPDNIMFLFDVASTASRSHRRLGSSLLGHLRVVDLANAIPIADVDELVAGDSNLQTLAYRSPEVLFGCGAPIVG